MKAIDGKGRFMRSIISIAAITGPAILTAGLFLVLYNNLYNGLFIVCALIGLNLLLAIIPVRRVSSIQAGSNLRFGAICSLTIVVAFLALEMLFPVLLPKDYAHIRDLSKAIRGVPQTDPGLFPVVFTSSGERKLTPAAFKPDSRSRVPAWHVPNEEFIYYGYEPNDRFRYVNIIKWNSRGYFDVEHTIKKPPGVYRLIFVGDSYVEALQAPLASSFHKLLEAKLNSQPEKPGSPPLRFQVIALGNSGSGQKRNLETLRDQALAYGPDMVVDMLCPNDFCDDDPDLDHERNLAMGQANPFLRGLIRHDYFLAAFALTRWNEVQRNRIAISPELLQWVARDRPRIEAAWAKTLGYVKTEHEICSKRGIDFRLVYVGSELEVKYAIDPEGAIAALNRMCGETGVKWDPTKTIRRIGRFCKENGIPFLCLVAPLTEAQLKTGKLVFSDHYTFFGHQVVADTLGKRLGLPTSERPRLSEKSVSQ